MASVPIPVPGGSFARGLAVQARVIGALMMRELHTRYGRENVGYLWMFLEPMMLASVIGALHAAQGHATLGSDIQPVPLGVLGYITFILFRGIVNRSEGGVEANAPLLYHRMVTIEDVVISRAVLELFSIFATLLLIMGLLIGFGLADLPARPLELLGAWGLMFWYCLGHSFIISSISHDNRTVGRLVHPYCYFMVGLSGAFFQLEWIPHPFRDILTWNPLCSIMEMARYGWFESAHDDYIFLVYTIGASLVTNALGLKLCRDLRRHVHLS